MRASLVLTAALAAVLAASSPARAAGRWPWPVEGPVAGAFRLGADPYRGGQRRGILIAAPAGAPVQAACGGDATFAGPVGRTGRVVAVACGPLSVTYARLGAASVRRGERVAPLARIGRVGPGGLLHLGVRVRARRHGYVDPLRLLAAAGRRPPPTPLAPPRGRPPAGPRIPVAPAPVRVPVVAPRFAPAPDRGARAPLARWWPAAGLGLLAGAGAITALRRGRAAAIRLPRGAAVRDPAA